ncbi:manganese superoxide dismutase [Penicillium verhagenii]|nr:manganese superoxide dismutase [Penicillium verhagenii]
MHVLPPLPYDYDALEPVISKQIMTLHHDKHHATYVTNLNAALKDHAAATQNGDFSAMISLQQKIRFNGGGHINHSLFWKNLTPPGTPANNIVTAAPVLREAILSRWGSEKVFIEAFEAALLGIQGSGWGWLIARGQHLEIITTKDQDPVTGDGVPLVGVDMWEHAFYLQYLNNKAGYVKAIWQIINWQEAENRYTSRTKL